MKKRYKILIAIGILLAILVTTGVVLYNKYNNINYVKLSESREELNVSEDVAEKSKQNNIKNILLLGVDKEENASDTIMVASIDTKNKTAKLVSILRDTYVYFGDNKVNKLNYAYHYGGAPNTIKTVNKLFNLDIDKYVKIYFDELPKIVDYLGGVDIDLTEAEAKYLNTISKKKVYKTGKNTLNGEQSLDYSRIRKIDNDFKRTDRQRNVIIAIFEKVKKIPVSNYPSVIADLSSTIETNISTMEILDLANIALDINTSNINELRIPLKETTEDSMIDDIYYLQWDQEINKNEVHKFIYGE